MEHLFEFVIKLRNDVSCSQQNIFPFSDHFDGFHMSKYCTILLSTLKDSMLKLAPFSWSAIVLSATCLGF